VLAPSPSPQPAASTAPAATAPPATERSGVELIQQQARDVGPLVKTDAVQALLRATADLPRIEPRTVYRNKPASLAYNADEAAKLSEAERAACTTKECDESFYYFTGYGTPVVYARPLEIYAAATGIPGFAGKRIFDFGYGGIGHLRLLAANGADAVGVEVEPLFRALYSQPGDQGEISARNGASGKLTLLHGSFPGNAEVRRAAGEGYDLVISKNVLKLGYIHPERPAPEHQLVKLGVDDATFVRALWEILKPGGYVLVYNICPAQAPADQPYIPWADGRFPFERAIVDRAGFEVLAWNQDDSAAILDFWFALDYAEGKSREELARELFAHYTLLRKPA
jgi:hypothetical protein